MHHKYDLTLVLACYNEAEIFTDSVDQIVNVLDKNQFTYEIIFIDDKSNDSTPKLIKQTLKKYPQKNFSAFFHQKNQGRGKTVAEGFKKAQGKIVGFVDIDLEIPAWYLPRFVESINRTTDGIIAWRIYDITLKGLMRWISSKGYIWLRQKLLNINIKDTEAGYKFFKRTKILPIVSKCKDNHWFWDTEIVARSLQARLKINEIPTVFIRRTDKTSTVKLIPDSIDYLLKLFKYKHQLQVKDEAHQ